MTTGSITHASATSIPAPRPGLAGTVAIVFLLLLGIGALAGGFALASRPDGSVMHFDVALLAGSPFSDYFIPGLILGGLFGVGSFAVATMGLLRRRIAPFLAFAIGCAQMIWIVAELAIIRELSFLHPTFFVVGLVIAVASLRWGWATFRGFLAAH